MVNKFDSIEIRLATPEDKSLPVYDNTKLEALDTCTRYGIMTYQMHKVWSDSKKSQALNAGSVLHEVFAAVRLWQLFYYDLEGSEYRDEITNNVGMRLYGKHRWNDKLFESFFAVNTREQLIQFCMAVLGTSDFEDDPEDKKRSMSNIENAAINYVNKWDFNRYPLWIRDKNDPNTDVGIEIKFELVITFKYSWQVSLNGGPGSHEQSYRFTGALDGLHYDPLMTNPDLSSGALFVVDNKTTSRMGSDYSFYDMNTQMQGYAVASTYFTGQTVDQAKVLISSFPLPASAAKTHGGLHIQPVFIEEYKIERWFNWFYKLAQIEQANLDNPFDASVSPHSCFRYFSNCALLPFCTASREEQVEALDSMVTKEWNVLAGNDDE